MRVEFKEQQLFDTKQLWCNQCGRMKTLITQGFHLHILLTITGTGCYLSQDPWRYQGQVETGSLTIHRPVLFVGFYNSLLRHRLISCTFTFMLFMSWVFTSFHRIVWQYNSQLCTDIHSNLCTACERHTSLYYTWFPV